MKEQLSKALGKREETSAERLVSCLGDSVRDISYNQKRGTWIVRYRKYGLTKDELSSNELEDFLTNG